MFNIHTYLSTYETTLSNVNKKSPKETLASYIFCWQKKTSFKILSQKMTVGAGISRENEKEYKNSMEWKLLEFEG